MEVEVDLERIVEDAEDRDEASELLNYWLEKIRDKVGEELESKYDDLKVEFQKELNKIWKGAG